MRHLLATLLAVALVATAGCAPPATEPASETLVVGELLGPGGDDGFSMAIERRDFRFPDDHGPHDGFRTEWWYYTGNLETEEGRRFGYQLTFFRSALTPGSTERQSGWATDHAFMAHFAVTDVEDEAFYSYERFAREALGLSGARGNPMRVWLEDWRADGDGDGRMRLTASTEDVALTLELETGKPPVLQGDGGLSQKGRAPGNASYYYSLTRMPTSGAVRVGQRSFVVSGQSWMDREWSTSALEEGQVGWDWFSLQLEGGRELMLYVLRRSDGTADSLSAGTLVSGDGSYRRLPLESWSLERLGVWMSPRSGVSYPAAWRIAIPDEELELEVRPLIPDQEVDHAFRYWEGAVGARGTIAGEAVTAQGYVELTGYE